MTIMVARADRHQCFNDDDDCARECDRRYSHREGHYVCSCTCSWCQQGCDIDDLEDEEEFDDHDCDEAEDGIVGECEERKEEMSERTTVQKIKGDLVANANAGAWLAAAEQVAKRTQAPLLKALNAQKVPTIASRYIQIALDTELGSGAYAVALGTLLPFIPRLADNKRAVKLAGYLQAHGMKTIISILVDPIIDGVEKVFLQAMKSLPDDTL